MVGAMKIAALLGFSAFVEASRGNPWPNSSNTTTSTTSSLDCQQNNCLRQFMGFPEVTAFCETYTTAVITQTTAYPSYVSHCSGNFSRISSACSCVVSSSMHPTTCQPSTITVTFTPPIQTYTTTHNFTTTILQISTATTDVYIPTTITSDIYSNVTQTKISTTTTTTEEETTTTNTATFYITDIETDTVPTTKTKTSISDRYIICTTTKTISTSYPYTIYTTVVSGYTTTTTLYTPTTVVSISTYNTTATVPTTTTAISVSDITLTQTVTTTSVTESNVSIEVPTTIEETQIITTTATQTVPSSFPVTYTNNKTTTEVDVTTYTTTAPAQTTTLPGVTSVQTISTTLPGVVTTVTAAGIITTTTLPGVTSVTTTTITLPGIPTTFPPVTVTVTNGIVTCPGPTPTTTLASALPTDYTWGCPPGYICNPPKPAGCNIFAEPPPDDYVCQPSQCVVSPPFTPVTAGWGDSIFSNDTSFYPPQEDYFNLSPFAFGLSYDIFSEEVEVLEVVGPNGVQTPTTVTTGNWASQTSITTQPTPDISGSSAKRVKRSIFRRASTVPAACYNECNNCFIEAQQVGKTPALCNNNPPSAFMDDLTSCQDCVAAHGDMTQQSLKAYVDPQFAQYLDFCQGEVAQSAVAPSSTPVQSEVSAAPSTTPTVVSQSQQAPASTPAPPTSTSAPPASSSTPTPISTANSIQTSSTKPSSTSAPPSSATTSVVLFTNSNSGRTLHPAHIFSLALTTVLTAVLSILI